MSARESRSLQGWEDVNALEAVIDAREALLCAALDVLAAERRLASNGSAPAVTKADTALYRAARDLTAAVGELPSGRQPKGWAA